MQSLKISHFSFYVGLEVYKEKAFVDDKHNITVFLSRLLLFKSRFGGRDWA